MLNQETLEAILSNLPRLRIAVLGDLFLDRYLDIDASLTEPSLETGLDAYQVTRVRSYPGAAGTVINNLASLGVGTIIPISIIGDDGEGYELRQALAAMPAVDSQFVIIRKDRRTPTYTKPMLCAPRRTPHELNRLDIKNRTRLPRDSEDQILAGLDQALPACDALLVLDQVSERNCGVVTDRVRRALAQHGAKQPAKCILVDSRLRVGRFMNVWLKPNLSELQKSRASAMTALQGAAMLARARRRPVFCTNGAEGIWVAAPGKPPELAPAVKVKGPVDTVGAGDSVSAGLACAAASGAALVQAASFANLVASITIQQIGVTGTASPVQVRERWRTARLSQKREPV